MSARCHYIQKLDFFQSTIRFLVLYLISASCTASLVGGYANEPSNGWRPDQLAGGCVNPNGLLLSAEPSPNFAGHPDGIIATPPEDSSKIIGRVKHTASAILAPLMRSGEVAVQSHFDWNRFNHKKGFMQIDIFGHNRLEICNKSQCASFNQSHHAIPFDSFHVIVL